MHLSKISLSAVYLVELMRHVARVCTRSYQLTIKAYKRQINNYEMAKTK